MKKIIAVSVLLTIFDFARAQTVMQSSGSPDGGIMHTETILIGSIWIVIGLSLIALLVAIYALTTIKTVILNEGLAEDKESTLISVENDSIASAGPSGTWWKWVLYPVIGAAAVYLLAFQIFHIFPEEGKNTPDQQNISENNKVPAKKASVAVPIDESNVEFSNDPAVIDTGKAVFIKNCVACHAPDGGGLVGPNLTDKYWIHGGSIRDIFKTIKYGVPAKGMITWQPVLSPEQIRDVACYILTLQGTTPANPKAPEGELYQPGKEKSDASSATAQNAR